MIIGFVNGLTANRSTHLDARHTLLRALFRRLSTPQVLLSRAPVFGECHFSSECMSSGLLIVAIQNLLGSRISYGFVPQPYSSLTRKFLKAF